MSAKTEAAFQLLKHSPFAYFWTARVCTTTAFQMQVVAIGWQMYALTHSAMDLGWVGLAQFLPAFFLTLVVGQVADSFDRRRVAAVCQFIQASVIALLALGSWQGWLTRELIFALVVVVGASRAFESPSMAALLPSLVPNEVLPRAVSWSASAVQAAFIMGPAIGGIVYVFGAAAVYCCSSVLFLIALISVLSIKSNAPPAKRDKVDLTSIFAGIHFIRRKPVVLGAISMDLFAVLLGGATALLPIYARDILNIGPWGLGILRSSPAVGALLMSVYLTYRPIERRTGPIMFAAVAVFGVATILFGVSKSFWLSLAALFVLGAADMISVVIRSSLVQLETPDEMRGRVSAVNFLFIGTSNQLGEFESGITAAWWGAPMAVMVGGVGTLLVVASWVFLFPALARRDHLVKPVEKN
ncbi:MAG TPA: MFS transporter [Pseudomonadales bacterium]|nr:MFS transporter [Pseudomonadales bacterium]